MSHGAVRQPAPGPLRLVQRLVNTIDLESGSDDLREPEAAQAWLHAAGLLDDDATVDADGLTRVVELREAIRALLLEHAGHGNAAEARDTVNATATRAALRPVLEPDGTSSLVPHAAGLDAALGRIVAAIHHAGDGSWRRLKACDRDTCRWAYYDHSKNRSGRWCAMGVCGSREKSRRAYRRRTAGTSAGPGKPATGRPDAARQGTS